MTTQSRTPKKPLRFNPCFRGTCSWCVFHVTPPCHVSRVSILVFVELALDGSVRSSLSGRSLEFQSLFSWNLLLMGELLRPRWRSHRVSILVFVELALDGNFQSWRPIDIKFQSLFSWNLLLMFTTNGLMPSRCICFNPCFRGTCSWWADQACSTSCRAGVSILVFVELALDESRCCGRRKTRSGFNPCFRGTCSWWHGSEDSTHTDSMFQSLFSWNLLLMEKNGIEIPIEVKSFNPCFRGTCSWCISPGNFMQSGQVSILVFVELALDEYVQRRIQDHDR